MFLNFALYFSNNSFYFTNCQKLYHDTIFKPQFSGILTLIFLLTISFTSFQQMIKKFPELEAEVCTY